MMSALGKNVKSIQVVYVLLAWRFLGDVMKPD